MNIMLIDLPALTLDQQEVPMVAESDADNFSGLFSQQFSGTPDNESQGIDSKEYLEEVPIQTDTSALTPKLPLGANGHEFLLQNPIKVSLDTNPAVNAPRELVDDFGQQTIKPDASVMVNVLASGAKGEMLPMGGNLLPDNAALDSANRGMIEKATAPSVTVATVFDAIRSGSSEVMLGRMPQVVQTPAVAPQPGGIIPVEGATTGVTEPGVSSVNFMTVMRESTVSEAAQLVARDRVIAPESTQVRSNDLTPGATLAAAARQSGADGMMRNLDFRTDQVPSRPGGSAGLTPRPAISVLASAGVNRPLGAERVVKGLKEIAVGDISFAGGVTLDRVLTSGEKISATDTLSARDLLSTLEYRNLEIPAQVSGNSSQQTIALPTGTVHAVSVLPHTPTPAAQATALPPQLETMTLARNADSMEWGSGLSERVNWMINQKQNTATIRLDPPFLGKLDVHIKIADDATTVTFHAQHLQTRDLIESASIRLRDLLQESGYQNVNVDVSQRQDQQQARSQTTSGADADQQDESHREQAFGHQEREQVRYFIGDGVVDTFA